MLNIRSNKIFLILVFIWLALGIFIRPMSIPDEGRYGDITRWMLMSGDWLVPRLDGIPFFHKPPLLHWLGAMLMSIFGVHVWVGRLIPLLAACAFITGIFVFVKHYRSDRLARTTVLVLSTSVLFYGGSQYINHDLLVATWITLAILSISHFVMSDCRQYLLLGYVFCALGFLSKGLIGVLIPGFVLLPWMIAAGYSRKILPALNPIGILIFCAIVLPWVLLVEQQYPDFTHYFFIEQQFDRFHGATFNNQQPFWFYYACLIVGFLPWLLLTQFQFKWDIITSFVSKPIALLLAWWFVAVSVFFSIPASKLVGYIYPALAPLAIVIAILSVSTIDRIKSVALNRFQRYAGFSLLALLSMALLYSRTNALHSTHHLTPSQAPFLLIAGILLAVITIVFAVLIVKQRINAIQLTTAISAIFSFSIAAIIGTLDYKNHATQLKFQSYLTTSTDLVFYHDYFYDVPFLINHPKPVYVVDDWVNATGDSTQLQLKDGLRFEPAKAQYLMDEQAFNQAIAHGKPMLVLAPANRTSDALKPYLLMQEKGYNVYGIHLSAAP